MLLAPPRILSLWFITLDRDLVPERGLDLELALDPERGPEGDSELGPGLDPDRNTGALDRGLVKRLLGLVTLPRGLAASEASFSTSGASCA